MLSCLAPRAPPQTPLTGLCTLRNRAGTITAYDSSFMLAVVACFWGMLVVADISYCGSKSWSSIIFTTSPLAKSWIGACYRRQNARVEHSLLDKLTLFSNASIVLEDVDTHRSNFRRRVNAQTKRRQSHVNAGTVPESENART